jgi:hypothetical protein
VARPVETPRPAPAQTKPESAPRPTADAPILREVTARPKSPVLNQLAGLLRNRESLRVAFVLNEIFDRPKCKRMRS